MSYPSLEIESSEKEYRKDVYQNYLDIDDVYIPMLESIEKETKINKNDKNIIFEVIRYMEENYRYVLPDNLFFPKDKNELIYFATKTKEGCCRHFASLAVLLYRYFGIPSRYARGYSLTCLKDESNPVYDTDAHAWPEVYIDDIGWIKIEVTFKGKKSSSQESNSGPNGKKNKTLDNHDSWKDIEEKDDNQKEEMENEIDYSLKSGLDLSGESSIGLIPGESKSMIETISKPKLDWRVLLNDFIQEEINDYTFMPPDRRFSESEFMLPSCNEKEEKLDKIFFFVDTSGSMTDDMIKDCYNEIKGAIDQFNGKIEGYIGNIDVGLRSLIPLNEFYDLKQVDANGRGGSDFRDIFKEIEKELIGELPKSIIVLTDGYIEYPTEKDSMGISVLWIINNKESNPPFGKIIRLE